MLFERAPLDEGFRCGEILPQTLRGGGATRIDLTPCAHRRFLLWNAAACCACMPPDEIARGPELGPVPSRRAW